jgi:hypothetical protein
LNLCFISEVPWDNRECTRNWNFTVILPSGDGDCLLSYLLLQPCSVRSGPNRLYWLSYSQRWASMRVCSHPHITLSLNEPGIK